MPIPRATALARALDTLAWLESVFRAGHPSVGPADLGSTAISPGAFQDVGRADQDQRGHQAALSKDGG